MGIELLSEPAGIGPVSPRSGAESGALDSGAHLLDPNLASLISAWPTLSEPVRAGILAMVRTAG
jgi:hypothetical protein